MLIDAWQTVRRILAVRLDNIGDVVMLSPALRALRQNLPQASITLMASPAGSQVAPLLPWIEDVLVWRPIWQDVSGDLLFDPQRELALVQILRERAFDAAIIFTSFSQSPYPPAYLCYLAGVPLRLGQSKEFAGSVLSQWVKALPDEIHQAERNLALLEAAGIMVEDRSLELVIPAEEQARAELILEHAGVDPTAPFILLAPGASCSARRYNVQKFAVVARSLVAQTDIPVVIVGSQREALTFSPLLEAAGDVAQTRITSLVGQTSLQELAGLIHRASLVIANNSASLHIADALQRPMVILYSGTERLGQWEPRNAPARLLRRETACSPCYNFRCPYGMECLDIAPQEVVRAALDLLNYRKESFPRFLGKSFLHDPATTQGE